MIAAKVSAFILSFVTGLNFSFADTKALSQTTLGKEKRACSGNVKPEKPSANERDQARRIRPIFASLAKQLAESPLQSLCDQMPDFSCWPDGYFTRGQIDLFESGKGKFLLRVPCTLSAYNQTSFFVAANIGPQTTPVQASGKKKQKPAKPAPNQAGSAAPMLVLFPTHPDFQTDPQLKALGLKPLEAIIGFRDFDSTKRKITAYTKGLGDGTLGHFHQYDVPANTLIPRLQVSIAKITDDHKDPFHYERGQVPPFVKSWIRMRSLKAGFGCLADFQNLQCRVFKK
ncbi:MAG: hypothetical protein U1E10_12675 [Bdellovibrionales bacterium]|nr:hypothetical protein [Bdellovibrionales bacterium]